MDNEMLYKTVKTILLNEWDPIGICEFEDAHDEYDAYVDPLCKMLSEGKNSTEVVMYLRWVVESMGLDGDEQVELAIAKKLVSLTSDSEGNPTQENP